MGAALAQGASQPVQWIEGAGGHNAPGALFQSAGRTRIEAFLRAAVGG
jgi:hypothetical protein